MRKSEREYYDHNPNWGKDLSCPDTIRIQETLALLPQGITTVLDIGCGDGRLTDRIPASLVIGLDFSDVGLTTVKVPKVVGSVDQLPFRDHAVDVVVCTEVLEHLGDDVLARTVDEIKRVAKKYILISTPCCENLFLSSTRCGQCGCVFHISWHVRSFDMPDLIKRFAGFNVKAWRFFGERQAYESPFWLWWIRRVGGKWPINEAAICPDCGNTRCGSEKGNWIAWVCERMYWRLAKIMPFRRKPYWMAILFERKSQSETDR